MSVDVSNVLVWGQGDDVDVDQSYSDAIDNFLGILVDGDQGLEIDGRKVLCRLIFLLLTVQL